MLRLAVLACCLPSPAHAGFAAQGATPPPGEGEVEEPIVLWHGQDSPKGSLSVDLLLDLADAPLMRWAPVPGSPDQLMGTPLLDDVVTTRLGGRYSISNRVGIAFTVPLVLSHKGFTPEASSPNLGDSEVSLPVRVAGHAGSNSRSNLTIVPSIRLPTGAPGQKLGDDRPGGSVVAAGSGSMGRIHGTANLGLELRAFEGEANVQPGPGLIGGLAIGGKVTEGVAVQMESRFHQRIAGARLADPPEGYIAAPGGSEIFLTGRGRLPGGTWINGGIGFSPNPGFAAARGRLFLGVGHHIGKQAAVAQVEPKKEPPPKPQKVAAVALPVVVMIQDEAGVALDGTVAIAGGKSSRVTGGRAELSLAAGPWSIEASSPGFGAQSRTLQLRPEQLSGETVTFILLPEQGDGVISVQLTSPEGEHIPDAQVSLDGRPVGTSASGGGVLVRGLSDAPVVVEAQAESFRDNRISAVVPTLDETPVELLLARQRGAVKVVVVDGNAAPIPGVRTRFSGPDRLGPYSLGELGDRTFVLRPGQWQVLVSHPDYGVQQRGVDLPDDDTELTRVDLVLQPPEKGDADLTIRVVDPNNRQVPGVLISLDGAPYGATSTGGQLHLEDLEAGPRTLSVAGDKVRASTAEIKLHPGLQEQLFVVEWQAGSTMVRARGAQGMASDAAARFQGPTQWPKLDLGPDGVEFLRLNAGIWQILVSSPSLGMAQQGVAIPVEARGLTIVDVLLGTPEERGNTLLVEVVDPAGEPVEGASVAVDRNSVGSTASLGTLAIPNIQPGTRIVAVAATPFSTEQRPITLSDTEQRERIALDWGIGAVRVRARSSNKPVEDAVVRIGGPRFVAATPVGPGGERLFGLEAGEWQVLVSSPELGLQQASLQVPDRPQLTELTVELGPAPKNVAQTIVRVQAPDGSPIPEAMVKLDERAPVAASGGYAALLGVTPGAHRIEITAPDFEPVVVDDVDLAEGTNERIIPMPWVPRPLSIKVTGPDGAVQATLALQGPVELPATLTDDQGAAQLELPPGTWQIMASAPGLGVQRRSVVLSEKTDVSTVSFSLKSAKVLVEGGTLSVSEQIFFPTGKASLNSRSSALLDEVANTMRAHPELVAIEIGGHTDPQGSTSVNMKLSRDRAAAVAQALIDRGVARERLVARGYGPTRPQAPNDTADGRAKNRRVEFVSETVD